jgi:carbamoyltransferase|nr:MAG TPA: putative carbamoyl transferase, NodU family [Caudoviricetes sp.]
MNYLLLTLGHCSSAIFVDNSAEQQNVIGYEQERLSGIKSDSQFPIDAINEIEHHVGFEAMKGCKVLISHWFNDYSSVRNQKLFEPNKYFTKKDFEKLQSYKPDGIAITDGHFTHHDAHAYSAYAFHDYNKKKPNIHKPLYCIVADGFGTNEEVLSIYCRRGFNEPELIHRTYGYQSSLGIFYQYATAYVGMKENQDEYKFLGYEAHIAEEFNDAALKHFDKCITKTVLYFRNHIMNDTQMMLPATNDIINFDNLSECRQYWYAQFSKVLEPFGGLSKDSFAARCAIAYYIQQTVENVLEMLIKEFKIDDICVVGGCFYNVKLNNKVLNSIKGDFCAMPLAGDQGAAIGMYAHIADKPFEFGDLCWGERRMYNAKKLLSGLGNAENVIVVDEAQSMSEEFINAIAQRIADNKIVNIVRGPMEFGPRALCNTSTLMLPSTENVAINNRMNNRNEVMPCAPVCTYKCAARLFDTDELERVVGSDRYMICTHDYIRPYSKTYGGVMHHKTLEQGTCTGRPQIVSQNDRFMVELLYKVEEICDAKCLVNTSFNAHGNPIVFDVMDIIRNFKYQCEHIDSEKRPILVVIL